MLSAVTASSSATASLMVLVGLAGGFIVVPLNAALQKQAGCTERGHLISTNIFLNMTAVLLASGALWLLRDVLGIDPSRILLLAGLATLAVTRAALWAFPSYAASEIGWIQLALRGAWRSGGDQPERDGAALDRDDIRRVPTPEQLRSA